MEKETYGERLTIDSTVFVWVPNLSNHMSLAREWKVGDGMEANLFEGWCVWVANLSNQRED